MTSSALDTTRATYDALAPVYDVVAAPFEWPVVQRGLTLFAAREGEQVLEIGHGTGRAAEALARAIGPRGHLRAVDLSPRMGEVARRRLERAGLSSVVSLESADATALILAPASLDGIFSAFTVETFPEAALPGLLSSWRAALRPGGRVVLVTMAPGGGAMASLYAWSHRVFPRLVDCRPLDPSPLLTAAGFHVEQQRASIAGIPAALTRAT